MKKLFALLLALCLTIASVSALAAQPTFDGEIKIGVITGITGPAALGGERATKGVTLAAEQINAAGGVLGKKLVIQIEDDAGSTAGAVNAENKLLGEGAVAVAGPLLSTNVIAVEQIVLGAKVPSVILGTSPKLYALENPYLFRVRASDAIVASSAAKFMYDNLGLRKIGILTNTDDFGSGALNVMKEYFKDKSDVTLTLQGVNTGDKDLTGQIVQFKNAGIEGLIYWGHEAEIVLMARQLDELGLEVPVLTSASLPQVLNTVTGEQIEGWYCAIDLSLEDDTPAIAQYIADFSERWGEKPELHSSAYYGGVKLLADAITRAGSTDGDAIRQALTETKDFKAVVGDFNCQANNDMLNGCCIIQFDANKAESIAAKITMN